MIPHQNSINVKHVPFNDIYFQYKTHVQFLWWSCMFFENILKVIMTSTYCVYYLFFSELVTYHHVTVRHFCFLFVLSIFLGRGRLCTHVRFFLGGGKGSTHVRFLFANISTPLTMSVYCLYAAMLNLHTKQHKIDWIFWLTGPIGLRYT